ncbi:hypothetical protein M426DRAFT_10533 [Hypoxylon sp. CI-4A]|nr:hypothetical protein M426DRAFT_10533 [Hypoxylon sp. CI-4A]
MAPDLNSLPPSSPSSTRPRIMTSSNDNGESAVRGDSASPSPRSASISLQAAATMNAGLQHEHTRRSSSSSLSRQQSQPQQIGRRRSTVLMNIQHNDPSIPSPGEMVEATSPHPISASSFHIEGDPRHTRAPSIGELHQELEEEQEAQVNRLLNTIRMQQVQLQQYQATHGQTPTTVAAEDPTPTSERSNSETLPILPESSTSVPRSPVLSQPRSSTDTLQRPSRTSSRGAPSPRLSSASNNAEGSEVQGGRDDRAYWRAEVQSLTRRNQMLMHRVRELEALLSQHYGGTLPSAAGGSGSIHELFHPSHLTLSTSASEENANAAESTAQDAATQNTASSAATATSAPTDTVPPTTASELAKED